MLRYVQYHTHQPGQPLGANCRPVPRTLEMGACQPLRTVLGSPRSSRFDWRLTELLSDRNPDSPLPPQISPPAGSPVVAAALRAPHVRNASLRLFLVSWRPSGSTKPS